MNRKKKVITGCLLAALMIPMSAAPTMAVVTAGESSGIDLESAVFDDAQQAVPVVIYVYVEDDADNPYNNSDRDVTIEFGGTGDYIITGKAYHVLDDDLYRKYHIQRIVTSLPSVGDDYYPVLTASDISATDLMSYLVAVNDKTPVDVSLGNAITASSLRTTLNEFYFVGSHSYDWVKNNGLSKLEEMYDLLHSESGNINDNKLGNAQIDEELFSYWQEQMEQDPTISGWQDEDGTVYTRDDMERLGYPITADVPGTDENLTVTDDTDDITDNTSDDTTTDDVPPVIPEDTPDVNNAGGIPPLAIVLVGIACAIAAVVIAFIRREKNESDLYID